MKISVIKIGGNVIDHPEKLEKFLTEFAKLEGAKILVHGGGKIASGLSKQMGITPKMVDGRRITDAQTLDIVTMTYAGLLNKKLVAKLQSLGCNALGLSGADAGVIHADKRPVKTVDYGFVGDPRDDGVNTSFLATAIKTGVVPVMCAITHDGEGQLLNTNADTIASTVAKAMSSVSDVDLVYCFEKKGVLSDPSDDDSVIELVNPENYTAYKDKKVITDGMIPKLDNAFEALEKGVSRVVIRSSNDLLEPSGTEILA
ncbi:acetylglutamate kinase (plasmid) [Fulvitalea axinellae]|uniref:Acetylglutamate kinase n=1 Tax=Fulvitalea axinellae TaxID=1182444 RepID=A0AAU9CGY4_9BACT|nr:acetylglutamate kinase [Fulvitalea axinellae]